ncbi:RDD family protein [Phenylobacterium sp.]|uniref:RDD family protein n=1 Tax=Phenylobacterium sp. TaxID=1871053 RepID=UPI002DEC4B9C|nr:RDD family protein [Phenylobacterium sp.]
MTDTEQGMRSRDLFWRRLGAGAVDIALLAAAASLAAVVLYGASGGKLRSTAFLKTTHCQAVQGISIKVVQGIPIPRAARPVAAQLCTIDMAGFETSRYVTVMLQAQEGEVVRSLAFSRPVDRQGLPMQPIILDWTYPFAFIVIMSLAETWFGATLGKRAFGLKVVAFDGAGRLPLGRALLRNLVIYGGATLVLVAPLVIALAGLRLPQLAYYGAVGVFGLLVLAPIAMLAEAAPRALYDRWAGAEVIRA